MVDSGHRERTIYLHLASLDHCAVCWKTGSNTQELRICEACGEKIYCSQKCQKSDWENHKRGCGSTDRIDLKSFYPLLCYLVHLNHLNGPKHPALEHKILGSPNPNTDDDYHDLLSFPDGKSFKLIALGDEIPSSSEGTYEWWPTAMSTQVRERLRNRIIAEGHLLAVLLAVCLSLASEMYTTTAVPEDEKPLLQYSERRRVRLAYQRTPIADFGIAKGRLEHIVVQDKLAYFHSEKEHFMEGQDPEDHYWIYFTTARGEELFLECGMGTFNMGIRVDTDAYANPRFYMLTLGKVYGFFHDREFRRNAPIFSERRTTLARFSMLRDPGVCQAIRYHDPGLQWPGKAGMLSLMDRIAGRTCSQEEKELFLKFCTTNSFILRQNIHYRAYRGFPSSPVVDWETDPDEKTCEEKRKKQPNGRTI
ncbi:unnamed protein product [Cyclocybe aegerita]|uniref:MYND-type domain-containing protein n=1 Tax=Cyclocybe aegerita TaxID=1973307 RepID=A0A8S0XQD0_CYCAE|nr:unnamed protein product [Cyclocybe aegerita]